MPTEPVALITGGAQGIGKAIAKLFLEHKINVVIVDNDKSALKETAKEFSPFGNIIFLPCNIAKEKEVKETVKKTLDKYGRIDYLINNAGIMIRKSIEKLSLEEWNNVISVNLTATFLFSKFAYKALKKAKGVIINISSTRAFMSEPHTESYAASKGGIEALTHALAISLGPDVRVNCISPGWIDVSEWKKSATRHPAKLTVSDHAQHPVGRVGKPDDIATMVLYLISHNAGFITGANINVDGGMTRIMIYV